MYEEVKEMVREISGMSDPEIALRATLEAVQEIAKEEDMELADVVPYSFYSEFYGQVLMAGLTPDAESTKDINREYWLRVADHIGPDFAQGLYHAAVFCTKVA